MIDSLLMLIRLALRNLRASPINMIIGGLILSGTFIFVVLGALLDSLNDSMARSVIGSLAGNVQIYSEKSKDELALYGNMSEPDLSAVDQFPKIKEALEKLDNVKTVVPMGVSGALITSGNVIDVTLEKLRQLQQAKTGSPPPLLKDVPAEELDKRIASEKAHMRQIIKVLQGDAEKARKDLLDTKTLDKDAVATLELVTKDDFWVKYDADPFGSLELLENKVAPQITDAQMLFLRYVGTDLDSFQKSFDRMEVIDGTAVPAGQRGFLIAKFFYEENMKLKNARRLDKIKEAIEARRTIKDDTELQRFVKENRSQTKDIVLQLDGIKTSTVVERLQKHLNSKDTDLASLLTVFFDATDENFMERYDFFYKEIAPLVELYRVRVGDTLTIKAFSRSGYVHAVNVKVYGTFAFKGLEKSPLAGTTNLMDLMSFRDLYGYLSADKAAELKEIQKETGAKTVSRENAEAELFGDGNTIEAQATAGLIDTDKELSGIGKKLRQEDLIKRVYTQHEINDGVVLNAAVMLKDPEKSKETIAQINDISTKEKLSIKAVSWQQASGFLGQLIMAFRLLLYAGVAFIFLVAVIIIIIGMVMATIQRTQIIGTMRAIGAQSSLILQMVVIEAVMLGVVFGGLGIALSTVFMLVWHSVGTAAPNDVAYFFFSGPRLYPNLQPMNVLLAFVVILPVTLIATIIPAVLATRISPLRAMQADE